ncbi:MAG: hypothetical protein A2015_06415 [Spirochaetes bacterium GWF1_31_7]|nr:MAG: hypothetical protein A2Y30_08250 [Spirochaetes bacterium GWE1_32_154]OHD51378.1 MAG: hypothetical protein A2Y29_14635 [Spirochaetes bacterium GWE2_31_10]OHD53104.1 MAG: hypothetical protein A2015_06415 [Spirochaetes bacterium GWF1_31_7]HBD94475.1 Abortive infection protein AbiEi [Spirochaetia bacterium]HBI36120.1 Abortive infection protein AbiEi [Spirochaetia bacterium]
MKKEIEKRIITLFIQNDGIIRTKDITDEKIHNTYLKKLEENGTIQKIKRGLYKLNEYDNEDELKEVCKIIPNGVICCLSAASFYELTTHNPAYYTIAIPRGTKIKFPEYPPIKLTYFSQNEYTLGIIKSDNITIYDIEKTVCDIIRFRKRIGTDIMKEVIQNYLKRKDKNITKLIEYSLKLRVAKQLKTYLDVLV